MCDCNTAEYESNTGVVNISTANPNLDGSGTMGTVLTATSTANGTYISSVTVKATGDTTQGMVRLFIDDGTTANLYMEIRIPASLQTGVVPAFGITIPVGISLKSTFILKASTQNAESFNVTAYGQDWTNCSCPA